MGFRTLEISKACEIHIKEGQLLITSEDGTAQIPVENLNLIMMHGANIRMSTMDISILTQNKVGIMTLDNKYLPTALITPYEGHSRQAKMMHAQINMIEEKKNDLWIQIIRQKIMNQADSLSILGRS